MARKTTGMDLLYSIEDRPPWYLCILLGFQHYLTMFGSTMIVPLLVTPQMCIPPTSTAKGEIIATLFFVSGIVTLLQTTFGIRLPIVQGATFSFLAPTFAILALPKWKCPSETEIEALMNETNGTFDIGEIWKPRMREIQGSIIVASFFQIVIGMTGAVGLLLRFIGPLAIMPCISLIGLTLFEPAGAFASKQWGVSCLTMALIFIFSQYLRNVNVPCFGYTSDRGCGRLTFPCFKMFPVILSVVIVWMFCAILTVAGALGDTPDEMGYHARTDIRLDVLQNTAWFRFPYPGQWGLPTVSTAGVFGMLAGVMASMLESIGDYFACARLCAAPPPPVHAINRGVLVEGVGCVLGGVWGSSNGTTSYSENVGAIGITKVGSRLVVQTAAVIMILLGMLSKFGALFVTMPDPIIGGVFCVMFGMITAVGISNLQYVDMNSTRNMSILGFSLFMGLVIPEWLKSNTDALRTGNAAFDQILYVLLSTGMFVGGVLGFILDNTIPGTVEERGLAEWRKQIDSTTPSDATTNVDGGATAGDGGAAADSSYDFPLCMPAIRRARPLRFVPICPTFSLDGLSCRQTQPAEAQSVSMLGSVATDTTDITKF